MAAPVKLSKADARRALALHHFTPRATQMDVFEQLRSIQFDPLSPVGSNHDLVLQARLAKYRIGDWQQTAYKNRLIYDGWDKMASLVPFEGWPIRRIFHAEHHGWFEKKIFEDHKDAVEFILRELTDKGPLLPKDFDFQLRRDDWKTSWHGPSVTKQTLRALWHSGLVMTAGRKHGHHLYDLTERVVPAEFLHRPMVEEKSAVRELVLDRHRAMGILRPNAPLAIWSVVSVRFGRKEAIESLTDAGEIVPLDIEGVLAHATPDFLALLDAPPRAPRTVFVAPLDPFLWDRQMVAHIFGFDYAWEVYVPQPKRRWGYYVLPVFYGDQLVARAEWWARDGVLELREWHPEPVKLTSKFWASFERAVKAFMRYSKTSATSSREHIDSNVKELLMSIGAAA